MNTLSSSPFIFGSIANAITADGICGSVSSHSRSVAASTSPEWVSLSFATAPMSPGPISSACPVSLPCGISSWPIRSFWCARQLCTWVSGIIVPW